MLLLEWNTIRKKQVNENVTKLNTDKDSGKYKVEEIRNSIVYIRKLESGHLPGLYYLVF